MKASYNHADDEAPEQKKIFVVVDDVRSRVYDASISYRVSGRLVVYMSNDSLQSGYFSKRISLANSTDKMAFMFGRELQDDVVMDINKTSVNFLYLNKFDYNPEEDMAGIELGEVTYE